MGRHTIGVQLTTSEVNLSCVVVQFIDLLILLHWDSIEMDINTSQGKSWIENNL